jgi:hypothetical protein
VFPLGAVAVFWFVAELSLASPVIVGVRPIATKTARNNRPKITDAS